MADRMTGFPELSPHEQAVVGTEGDYLWGEAISLPARERPDTVQISLRLDRDLLDRMRDIAGQRGLTVSDLTRAALRGYLRGGAGRLSNVVVTVGQTPMLVQIAGREAEMPSSRRAELPDERIAVESPGIYELETAVG